MANLERTRFWVDIELHLPIAEECGDMTEITIESIFDAKAGHSVGIAE
jgi:hypothetical protein